MAGLADFSVDFSSLATLPQLADQAKSREALRGLGSLDFSNPAAVEKVASNIFSTNPAVAIQLLQAANQRRAVDERNKSIDAAYFGLALPSGTGVSGAESVNVSAPSGEYTLPEWAQPPKKEEKTRVPLPSANAPVNVPSPTVPATPSDSTPRATPSDSTPSIGRIGPSAALPMGALPGLASNDASLLPRQNAPTSVPITQLAGPPPTLDTVPPATPIPPAGTQTSLPPAAAAPTAPIAPPSPMTVRQGAATELQNRIQQVVEAVRNGRIRKEDAIPILSNLRALQSQAARTSPAMEAFTLTQQQRRARNEEPQTYPEFIQSEATAKEQGPALLKDVKEYQTTAQAASRQRSIYNALDIVSNKLVAGNETIGKWADTYAGVAEYVRSAARNLGLSEGEANAIMSILPASDDAIKAWGQRRVFESLRNQLVLTKIRSLGAGFSNADRDFMLAIAGDMMNSESGRKALFRAMKLLADRDVEVGRLAGDYFKKRKDKGGNSPELNDYIAQLGENRPIFKYSDGSFTPEGQALQDAFETSSGNSKTAPIPRATLPLNYNYIPGGG